ncbi:DUF3331 domain-containing protein [Paraburkholderia tropica]|uniref:DUF3331 domain-containing protein n=1 Tax=Paraburkholderia tropica TaxID=92647 RepID=UPI002AB0B153|nr:DUF3331 domain-containing protein [Paraburkholderia tropica]
MAERFYLTSPIVVQQVTKNPRWEHMLRMMGVIAGEATHYCLQRAHEQTAPLKPQAIVTMSIVERLDESILVLSWSGSLIGHIAEDVWRCCAAKHADRCLLSNKAIKRGDRVYLRLTRKNGLVSKRMIDAKILESTVSQKKLAFKILAGTR